MPIHNGSQKISNIYLGGTKIKEVYNGSTLVYTSGIPMFGYKYTSGGNTAYLFMIGGMSASYYLVYAGSSTKPLYTITEITGNIGASGSKIKQGSTTYTYNRVLTVNGIKLYCYSKTTSGLTTEIGVLKNAVVGGKCIGGLQFEKPTSANSSQVKWGNYTYSRYSSIDFLFTGS